MVRWGNHECWWNHKPTWRWWGSANFGSSPMLTWVAQIGTSHLGGTSSTLTESIWKLVKKPKDMVPISNKWVLTKKHNKEGNIIKFKAHLVAHGFTQHPSLDYNKTYLPIILFEMIQALLAMVASKRLKVQQLDVKGAYLNRILTQPIYMQQPIGFEDGSRLVCLLIKSIYRLKLLQCCSGYGQHTIEQVGTLWSQGCIEPRWIVLRGKGESPLRLIQRSESKCWIDTEDST